MLVVVDAARFGLFEGLAALLRRWLLLSVVLLRADGSDRGCARLGDVPGRVAPAADDGRALVDRVCGVICYPIDCREQSNASFLPGLALEWRLEIERYCRARRALHKEVLRPDADDIVAADFSTSSARARLLLKKLLL
jgi:hypothetical protein